MVGLSVYVLFQMEKILGERGASDFQDKINQICLPY